MHKMTIVLASLALIAGASSAVADDSGHTSINSLNMQQKSSNDPIAPMKDGMAPSQSALTRDCATAQSGSNMNCKPKMQ